MAIEYVITLFIAGILLGTFLGIFAVLSATWFYFRNDMLKKQMEETSEKRDKYDRT